MAQISKNINRSGLSWVKDSGAFRWYTMGHDSAIKGTYRITTTSTSSITNIKLMIDARPDIAKGYSRRGVSKDLRSLG